MLDCFLWLRGCGLSETFPRSQPDSRLRMAGLAKRNQSSAWASAEIFPEGGGQSQHFAYLFRRLAM